MPDFRCGDKPPESIENSLAVSFVGLGRNTMAFSGAADLHGSLKPYHFQIFGGQIMPKSSSYENSPKNFSYVFPARTLYRLPLEAESNGRAVRT